LCGSPTIEKFTVNDCKSPKCCETITLYSGKLVNDPADWIIGILKEYKIPYRISGGFAARIYGSRRSLADIDIEIPDSKFNEIIPEIKPYIKIGPKQFKDKQMDTYGLSMEYKGQIIDISGTETEKLFDVRKDNWVKSKIDLSKVIKRKVYGKIVNVIRKEDLIAYKQMIRRKVDIEDIKAIS